MSIFKSCDIRGVYGTELDESTAFLLGRAVGTRLSGKSVVVGGDVRLSTPGLKAAAIDGLFQSGAHVIDVDLLPTPALYLAQRETRSPGALMVTASHNPPQYNGFKIALGDLPVTPEDLLSIETQMREERFVDAEGSLQEQSVLPQYAAFLVRRFLGLKQRRVVVDAGNGSMGTVAPRILRGVGQQVDELYCEPDGTFPHRDPNPAIPANLAVLRDRVTTTGASLGLAFDGDGDRVIFVDERGRVLPADRTLVLFVRHLLARHPGATVVYDQKSSSIVPEEVATAGGRALVERSGHAFIRRRLLTENALLGGEISGHYFFDELGGDDSLYASLLMLRVLDALGMALGAAMDTVPSYPISPEMRIPCSAEAARQVLLEIESAFAGHPMEKLDGVRVLFDGGWALARLSVTEPILSLRYEAHTQSGLEEIARRLRDASPSLAFLMADAGL